MIRLEWSGKRPVIDRHFGIPTEALASVPAIWHEGQSRGKPF